MTNVPDNPWTTLEPPLPGKRSQGAFVEHARALAKVCRGERTEEAIDQDPRSTSPVAIDHHAIGIVSGDGDGLLERATLEPRIAAPEYETLHATVAGNQRQLRRQ